MTKRICLIICVLATLSACASVKIDRAIEQYESASSTVQLGDSKQKVLAILMPTQERLESSTRKSSEAYMAEGKKVEIFYFRSGRQPDGLTTDDEFTPYVFTDDVLTAIGWQVLGGPKSVGQVQSDTNIHINTQQQKCTTIYQSTKGYQTICR